ncbi:MAG: TetR/AcrR family transcriptional regulator [Bacteroidaceae bacterium]|nr:TetR/AcrR family transcriptional regulator [Bacteroidaceae bacterium]
MPISKTKLKLVDVARQLFAKNGLEATTMNDIAVASGKGRRTLYTYFKSKDEVYMAVIEQELSIMSQKMIALGKQKMPPEEKLVAIIYTHLNLIKEAVQRNGNLRAEFFRDIWSVAKVRKRFDVAELAFIAHVLREGVAQRRFIVPNINLLAEVIHYAVKGLEVPYIYGRLGEGLNMASSRPLVQRIINGALGVRIF